ncbi:hypothetical protein [Sphingomonas sp.]|uniref:hypothetical protein n=1 Tax=Sphingomonas sp. TaxID=28214 RepID=UPI000DBBD957|nr:hypothetical protein [Sphingomonas sp.]PZT94007.1 MAG: hypothetical protein DI625_07595 [Sphingomonas sp.]
MPFMQPVAGNDDAIAAADWNEWYGDPARWPVSGYVFLADAAMRLGRILCYPWYDELFMAAGRPRMALPRPDLFLEHPEWSPYRDGSGVVTVEQNVEAGMWRPDDWTDDEEERLEEADANNNLRFAGQLAVRAIARGIATLAAEDKIKTIARPFDGSPPIPIDADDWDLLDPIDRIATCRITPHDRMARGASGTHLVFVDANQLEKRLRAYARDNQVALNSDGITVIDGGLLGAPKQAPTEHLERICEEAMREHLHEAENKDIISAALKEAVEMRTNRKFSKKVFDRARAKLLPDFRELARPGRRRTPQPPTRGH